MVFRNGLFAKNLKNTQQKPGPISEPLSKRINAIRFPMILLIVFGHNMISGDNIAGQTINIEISEEMNLIRLLISGIFARCTIPLFFLLSGYILFLKEKNFLVVLKKKTKTILIPYFLWISISVLFYFIVQTFSNKYYQSPEVYVRGFSWLDWIDVYCGCFTSRAPFPLVYPLWFLKDLFILSISFTLIKKCIDKFPVAYLVILVILWISVPPINFLRFESLLFFSLGYYLVKYNYSIDIFDKIRYLDIIILYTITILLELTMGDKLTGIQKVNAVIGFVFYLKLSEFLIVNDKEFEVFKYLGGFSFWIFVSHEPTLNIIRSAWVRLLPMDGFYVLIQYFGAVFLTVIIVLGIGIIVKKTMPSIYNVLSGNR